MCATLLQAFDFKWDRETGGTEPTSVVHDALASDLDMNDTWLYVDLIHKFLRIFLLKDIQSAEAIQLASYVITFLGYWETSLLKV